MILLVSFCNLTRCVTQSPLHQFIRYRNFLLNYGFLAKNLNLYPSFGNSTTHIAIAYSSDFCLAFQLVEFHEFVRNVCILLCECRKLSWFAQKLWLCIWFHCCKLGMNLSHPKFESSSVPQNWLKSILNKHSGYLFHFEFNCSNITSEKPPGTS